MAARFTREKNFRHPVESRDRTCLQDPGFRWDDVKEERGPRAKRAISIPNPR
jgi:hypothetical protein